MFRSESDLKVHVQNLEFLPLKRVAPEAGCFGCNYDAWISANIFRKNRAMGKSKSLF